MEIKDFVKPNLIKEEHSNESKSKECPNKKEVDCLMGKLIDIKKEVDELQDVFPEGKSEKLDIFTDIQSGIDLCIHHLIDLIKE